MALSNSWSDTAQKNLTQMTQPWHRYTSSHLKQLNSKFNSEDSSWTEVEWDQVRQHNLHLQLFLADEVKD